MTTDIGLKTITKKVRDPSLNGDLFNQERLSRHGALKASDGSEYVGTKRNPNQSPGPEAWRRQRRHKARQIRRGIAVEGYEVITLEMRHVMGRII